MARVNRDRPVDHTRIPSAAEFAATPTMGRRQTEQAVAGVPGLRIAVYPSGRRTYVYRFRDPVTGRKTCKTLGLVD